MSASSYKLNRTGDFTVKTTGPNHCGTTDVLSIKYRLVVTCAATSVDSRGFLFDQVRIDKWFQAQRTTELSCELYAEHCARALYRMIRAENPGLTPTSVNLALSPAPYAAEIEFGWTANADGTPSIPRIQSRPIEFRKQNLALDLTWGLFV